MLFLTLYENFFFCLIVMKENNGWRDPTKHFYPKNKKKEEITFW